jgi:hypothetical protein
LAVSKKQTIFARNLQTLIYETKIDHESSPLRPRAPALLTKRATFHHSGGMATPAGLLHPRATRGVPFLFFKERKPISKTNIN